ncbi:N-acetyltransferase [Streptomyces sp. GC420]|uniref:GNAT family N-acetyltransferase n=1 Tax=Streptomyces sp. GC420 TaxID=2697568 RepID=UPI001AA116BA|nr:GNAT family N-acetyltransferase [Streptomyces sp. GC420]
MTTTLRPAEPLQNGPRGALSRRFDVCVNSRPVGAIHLATHERFGSAVGRIVSLEIDERDRRRGRGCVAALAAEEVLRGWGCRRVEVSVPAGAAGALRLATALGYSERSRFMSKPLPTEPPDLPEGTTGRPMTPDEFRIWDTEARGRYARSMADLGLTEEEARARAAEDQSAVLPEGLGTPDTYLGALTHSGAEAVGTIWIALNDVRIGTPCAYVLDIEVRHAHRGHGHGRSLMLLAERVALAAGETRVGLNVFAGNAPAERLYESLGYRPTAHHCFKTLL